MPLKANSMMTIGVCRRTQHWRPTALVFWIAVCISSAGIVQTASAQAQTPAKDLWQTYMDAALYSDQSNDFAAEAVTLNAALAYANKRDLQGQRPALTRLPLMLAYGELGRKDLIKPLSDLGMHVDVSNLDKLFYNYIETVDDFAASYHSRWNAHENDNPSDDDKQGFRFYGWKNSYLIDVALRTKLRSRDKIGLANALAGTGGAYAEADYNCAGYEYGRAFETYRDFADTRDAMTVAEIQFSGENPITPTTHQQSTLQVADDTRVYLLVRFGDSMRALASKTLRSQSGSDSLTRPDVSKCDAFGPPERTPLPVGFDSQVNRAAEYYDDVSKLMTGMHQYWPGNPLFGVLDNSEGLLEAMKFARSKTHPGQYPDSLTKSKGAYAGSLAILTHASGPKSQMVQVVAQNYVDVLVEGGLTDEAKKIEIQYGVSPSAQSK